MQLIAANWKMFKNSSEAKSMINELGAILGNAAPENREVVIFPPFIALECASEEAKNIKGLAIGAQDVYPATEGAFTGEISPSMIKSCGADWVLTGHSERRHVIGESDGFVGQKTAFSLENGLKTILCIGETLEERESGKLEEVLKRQLEQGLLNIPQNICSCSLVVAYEPVWAIGTGKTANNQDILDAHAIVRSLLKNIPNIDAEKTKILYGGSVKGENAGEILSLKNVDGVLVGGASLKADSFAQIINA